VLKDRQATHTFRTQKLGFLHALPDGKVLPARRYELACPVLADFGCFCDAGCLGLIYMMPCHGRIDLGFLLKVF